MSCCSSTKSLGGSLQGKGDQGATALWREGQVELLRSSKKRHRTDQGVKTGQSCHQDRVLQGQLNFAKCRNALDQESHGKSRSSRHAGWTSPKGLPGCHIWARRGFLQAWASADRKLNTTAYVFQHKVKRQERGMKAQRSPQRTSPMLMERCRVFWICWFKGLG